jgi:signal transduction histidine kinase
MPPAPQNNTPSPAKPPPRGTLARQLYWIVSLRWVAGTTVIVGGMADLFWLHWYGRGRHIAAVGAVILLYNVFFWTFSRRNGKSAARRVGPPNGGDTYGLVWGQILADLACLTALVNWTGGYDSPLRGLFVLHMVFASLLLPRAMAFGVALVAIGMVEGVLAANNMPEFGAAGIVRRTPQEVAVGVGWDATLLATVYLASRVARDLRRQGHRLARQNVRVRRMAERLRRQQEALVQHEKMFALGQMAAGVAHEVANPLASMDGLMQLLERRPEKVTPENLARLREQVARINQIVRQLTTFARAEGADAQSGEWRDESLNAVVTRGLEVLRFDERIKKMTVERQLDEHLRPVRMQPAALEQVLVNLMLNATDALEGTPSPRVVVKTEAGAGWVEMSVSDNGPGMTEEVRARIFEPFFTTKAVGKGTGLGLSVSYSLVKKHGGEILVDSAVGMGAVFRVRLPR